MKAPLRILAIVSLFFVTACGGDGPDDRKDDDIPEPCWFQMGGAIQGTPLSLAAVVSTLAGPVPGAMDGTGIEARFASPYGIAAYGGSLYLTDGVGAIRKVEVATGKVTTIAGGATAGAADGVGGQFNNPLGIATDGTNLYLADTENFSIRKVALATGAVSTLATGLHRPTGLVVQGTSLYVADSWSIRKVDIASGLVTTVAGNIGEFTSRDIVTDGSHLFVTAGLSVKKVAIATGVVTTLAGADGLSGSTDGVGDAARFTNLAGIATDGANLFVNDGNRVRKIAIATGAVTTLAGSAETSGAADGPGATARFNVPTGMATYGGNLFVTDLLNKTIRKVATGTGVVTTLAGTPAIGATDGTAAGRFNFPRGVTTDGLNLFVTDKYNYTVRKISIPSGEVTTLAGTAGISGTTDGTGATATFYSPCGITTDGTNLYLIDGTVIRKIVAATGVVTTLATADGAAVQFSIPQGITTDGTSLYVTDNSVIRQVAIATGTVTTLAGSATDQGATDGIGSAARFAGNLQGLTTDGINLYVADNKNNTIRKVVIATGQVTTLAGNPAYQGSVDGTGAAANFYLPTDITTDGTSLYVADAGGHTIRKVEIATGIVKTIAGMAKSWGPLDGTGAAARFNDPSGITTDGQKLYVADMGNQAIRMIR